MFVLRKGILSFSNLFLVSILQCEANSTFLSDNRTNVIDKFVCNSVYTLINSFAGRQPIYQLLQILKFFSDM